MLKQANGNGTINGAGNRQKEIELVGFKSKQVCPISNLLPYQNISAISFVLSTRAFERNLKHAVTVVHNQAGQGIRGLFVENLHLDEEVVGQPK